VTQSPSGRRRFPWKSIVRTLVLTGAAVLAAATAGPVFAQSRLLDEVWVGGFAHDTSDLGAGKESNTEDAMVEVDSGRPGVLRFLGAPRIGASLSLNTAGLSNFGALSLVWDHHLFSRLSGTLEFGMGLTDGVSALPDGAAGAYDARHRLLLGSKVLFREAGGLDWRLSDHWRVGAEFVHLSNGLILAKDHNQGINDAGLRLGYEF
jgi:hypothetical protein